MTNLKQQEKAVKAIELYTAWQRAAYAAGNVDAGRFYQWVIDYWVLKYF